MVRFQNWEEKNTNNYRERYCLSTDGLSIIWCVMLSSVSSYVDPANIEDSHEASPSHARITKTTDSRGTSRLMKNFKPLKRVLSRSIASASSFSPPSACYIIANYSWNILPIKRLFFYRGKFVYLKFFLCFWNVCYKTRIQGRNKFVVLFNSL